MRVADGGDRGRGLPGGGEELAHEDQLRLGGVLELVEQHDPEAVALGLPEVDGLTVLDPVGKPFDPEHHQAISQADASGAAPGSVVQVFQKGYLLGGRLLRPALVVVARHD